MFAEAVSGLNAPIFLNNKQSRTTNLTKKQPRSILTNGKKKKNKRRIGRVGWKHSDIRYFEATSPASHHRGMIFSFDEEDTDIQSSEPTINRQNRNNDNTDYNDNKTKTEVAFSIPPRRPRRKSWEEVPIPSRDFEDENENFDEVDEELDNANENIDKLSESKPIHFTVPPRRSNSPPLSDLIDIEQLQVENMSLKKELEELYHQYEEEMQQNEEEKLELQHQIETLQREKVELEQQNLDQLALNTRAAQPTSSHLSRNAPPPPQNLQLPSRDHTVNGKHMNEEEELYFDTNQVDEESSSDEDWTSEEDDEDAENDKDDYDEYDDDEYDDNDQHHDAMMHPVSRNDVPPPRRVVPSPPHLDGSQISSTSTIDPPSTPSGPPSAGSSLRRKLSQRGMKVFKQAHT